MQKVHEESTVEFIIHLTMNKKKFKDAYDIGENMAVLSGEGKNYTIINKETGKATCK